MDKLKELMKRDWIISGFYDNGIFYLDATKYQLRSASHADLEMAVLILYAKCTEEPEVANMTIDKLYRGENNVPTSP